MRSFLATTKNSREIWFWIAGYLHYDRLQIYYLLFEPAELMGKLEVGVCPKRLVLDLAAAMLFANQSFGY